MQEVELGQGPGRKGRKETKVLPKGEKHSPMVIAHRGFSGAVPENTLAAFRRAIEIGSDGIELDIQLSRDAKVMVRHDETLKKTTDGRGRLADYTLEELKKLDAGSWFDPQFSGERIPTLKEVLDLAEGRVLVNIEIKQPHHGPYPITELADRALKIVKKAGMIQEVVFSSFNPVSLEWIKKKDPRVPVALLFHGKWNSLPQVTQGEKYSQLNLRRTYLTRTKIARIHREGMKVHVYTVNSARELERFVKWGADGIITNYPDRLLSLLGEKKSGWDQGKTS